MPLLYETLTLTSVGTTDYNTPPECKGSSLGTLSSVATTTAASTYKTIYLDLAPLGRLARYILPPLSPSQPVIAEKKISCWGKEPSRSSLPSLLSLVSFLLTF